MSDTQGPKQLLKKIDMSDVRVLVIGVVLLIVPVAILFYFSSGGSSKKMSQEKMKTMVVRKNVFNFGSSQAGSSSGSSASNARGRGSGWFSSSSPEKQVVNELEEAFKLVKRSKASERFPPGTTEEQKDAYRAEHHPTLVEGRGEMEKGNYLLAESLLLKAFEESAGNTFQQVYTMGALCELYELTQDQKKLEAAFKQFMDLVAKLPPDYGGGDLAASVRNAYMALKQLQDGADPAKVAQGLGDVEAVKQGAIPTGKVSQGLGKSLYSFPAKFE